MSAPPTDVTIGPGSPRDPEVARLIEELDAYQRSLYPAGSTHLLDLDALAGADFRFFVARSVTDVLGCGALRVDRDGYGEIKRMFIRPHARGKKLGKRILIHLETQAREEGLRWLRLETGVHQPEAIGLYRSAGFVERGPFGDYGPDPLSVFMEKPLP